ncbi:capsule assembly protein Wzi [Marinomonas alcarazii]|uniref:Capsule assembly protein Wzi n=1 Tax=Marinomonas alcarazii TaxID=491949 RepID=A0A318UVL8_9GAMM|nr:capsule assembly Wzi family protein [Marinomonas alcarazii]PYF79871.1 capsule assembly protein Wzi [Marinomonas alcarazii]
MSSFNVKTTFWLAFLGCASAPVIASPWLEANDPFLRSSLVLLSDTGQLRSPVNHYPMRWSMFGDDLTYTKQESDTVLLANQELLYTLNTAKLNRGNRMFRLLHGTNPSLPLGFGQFNEDEKGVYSSFEHLGDSFSYRLTAGYSEYQDDTSLNLDNSYLAFSAGAWFWSIGNIDRWWGQGWQHNLILGSYAKAAPDISVSYLGENDMLGVWSVESILAKPAKSDYDYHSATRLVSKPFSLFEYGVTYQTWLSGMDSGEQDEQLALDAKLTLPRIASLYHSVYAEAASTADSTELGAWLLGWTGSFPVGNNTARIVLESQQTTDAHDTTLWKSGSYPSVTDGVANTSYLLDDSASIAFYLQLANDHQVGLSYQSATQNDEKTNTSQFTYNLPALAGMVRLGASYQQVKGGDNQTNLWADYEFRF